MRRKFRRRGAILVIVALCLVVLLGVLGLTVDVGNYFSERRNVQAAADAAALAAATDLYTNYATNNGVDTNGTANSVALATALAAGYNNDGTNSMVTVRLNGSNYLGGPNSGKAIPRGYAEVTITSFNQRYFSAVLASDTVPITARAVARGLSPVSKVGILLLSPNANPALDVQNGNVTVTGGSIMINSSGAQAVRESQNGSISTVELDIAGGASLSGTNSIGKMQTGMPSMPNPLAFLPVPTQPATVLTPTSMKLTAAQVAGLNSAGVSVTVNDTVQYYTPGRYSSLSFSGNTIAVFAQANAGNGGVYYIDGGISVTGNAQVAMDPTGSGGMMLYSASNTGINIGGNGVVSLSGLTSGTYRGLLFFQNPAGGDSSIGGNGSFNMVGALYAPNSNVTINGNGSANPLSSQIISNTVTMRGNNGTLNLSTSPSVLTHVRQLGLVE